MRVVSQNKRKQSSLLHVLMSMCDYSQKEDELDRSKEMITFQQACSNIVESEEQLVEDLYTLIQVCVTIVNSQQYCTETAMSLKFVPLPLQYVSTFIINLHSCDSQARLPNNNCVAFVRYSI